jgi:hypothetical protein
MMDEFDVNISIPPATEEKDIVRVSGAPANVARAKAALDEKVQHLDAELKDRVSTRCYYINLCFVSKIRLKINIFMRHLYKIYVL